MKHGRAQRPAPGTHAARGAGLRVRTWSRSTGKLHLGSLLSGGSRPGRVRISTPCRDTQNTSVKVFTPTAVVLLNVRAGALHLG